MQLRSFRCVLLLAAAAVGFFDVSSAAAQEVTLRLHQFLPAQAAAPLNFIAPWARKVEAESKGRIKVELYPSMQLGGSPPQLYDQVKDGVVDIIWTLPGYTAGRFPRTEAFELPFIAGNAEQSSVAAWHFYEKHLREEFRDVKVLAVHTHSPGQIHLKGDGVRKLEDMKGKKLRAPTRTVTELLKGLGATPIGMPVPQLPEALSRGVIDGAVVPWEVTAPLKVAELVNTHTTFSGNRSLYVALFVFAMNKSKYESLPADLKKVIDDNAGVEPSRLAGRAQDGGDAPGIAAAKARGNTIVTLDAAETARWKAASQAVIDAWIREMDGKGQNGRQLVDDVRALIEKYAGAAN